MVQTSPDKATKDIKVLIEMAIHELCITQERVTEVHQVICQEIHPRITHALSSLDEIMALQAIEMDKDTHQTFQLACQTAATLQKEMEFLSAEDTSLPVFQKEKDKMPSETSERDEENFILIVPKAMKPLQAPELQKALDIRTIQFLYSLGIFNPKQY